MNQARAPQVPQGVPRVELEIWHLPQELLVAFTFEGVELFRQAGVADHVDLTPEQRESLRDHNVIVTHNHPLERSFSHQDLNMACVYNIAILRAISPAYLYVLTPPADGWDSAWCEHVLFRRGPQIEAEVNTELNERVLRGDMTVEQARQIGQHTTNTRLSREFSFGYWRLDL